MAKPRPTGARAQAPFGDHETDELAQQLKVLGNARRLGILQALIEPAYIEEIASHIGTARQTAQEHVDKLVAIGVVERRRGQRETGAVTEYVVAPQRLFSIFMRFGKLGGLEPDAARNDDLRQLTTPIGTGVLPNQATTTWRLDLVHGMRVGRSIALTGDGPWLIGREPTAHICIDYDPFVSTRHAEVRRKPNGDGYEIADLYASNGTTLDWMPLERGGTGPGEHGTLIGVGKSLLLLRRP